MAHTKLTVNNGPAGKQVQTEVAIASGEQIMPFYGRLTGAATRYSLQVGIDRHLEPDEDGNHTGQYIWRFLNHHCDPNCKVDTDTLTLVAIRHIGAMEELSINYNATEGILAEPFNCVCGAANCAGIIKGYFELTEEEKESIEEITAPYLKGVYQ